MRMELESVFHEQHFRTKFSPLLILAESMLTFNNKKSCFFFLIDLKKNVHTVTTHFVCLRKMLRDT